MYISVLKLCKCLPLNNGLFDFVQLYYHNIEIILWWGKV